VPVVAVTVDQLWRPQPGGIATYARGLLRGLRQLDSPWRALALAPRGGDTYGLDVPVRHAPLGVRGVTQLWSRWPLGVGPGVDAVHATSLAGPFRGAPRHAVALHDLLWRDEPSASTPAGIRFHERRLRRVLERDDLRLVLTSPPLVDRLRAEGVDAARLFQVQMGVDDDVEPAESGEVRALLARHGVHGPYVLYAGTREPRKNLARLVKAHQAALALAPDLGPLVLVGPAGWGEESLDAAIVLGSQTRALFKGLVREAGIFAYVPLREGWGLPAVEALALGTRVVVSSTTPSGWGNNEVVAVDPLDEASITQGLLDALEQGDDDAARRQRRQSVATLTWRACAQAHLAAWS
jgi:glycosyltransferase involved in cell wall biosynthesis